MASQPGGLHSDLVFFPTTGAFTCPKNGVKTENVKVQNAVLVSGLTNTDIDNELIEFLEAFGPVSRHIKLTGGQTLHCETRN